MDRLKSEGRRFDPDDISIDGARRLQRATLARQVRRRLDPDEWKGWINQANVVDIAGDNRVTSFTSTEGDVDIDNVGVTSAAADGAYCTRSAQGQRRDLDVR
jgi:hypothetical protein